MFWVVLVLIVCACAAAILYTIGIWAALKHKASARSIPQLDTWPALSLLKPLKGLEESLEDNLRSFFEQDYPGALQIVFATSEPDDPALEIAKSLAEAYPDIDVVFAISDPEFGLNPKVANLAGAINAARHDLMLQSDANVRASADYVRRIVGELVTEEASLLTSLVVGVGEQSLSAAMENLQLTAFIAPAMCTALHLAGVECVVGKSMLFRRSELDALGGIEQVRDILCEDFVLGERYRDAGKTIVLSPTTVQNINETMGLRQFLSRHTRWLQMRVVIHVGSFIADLFANPIGLATLAMLASGFQKHVVFFWVAITIYKMIGDNLLLTTLRGHSMALRHAWVGPVKDLVMVGVWVYSAFSRTVTWRGRKLRFGKGSVLRR